jgi:hypothetical protein
MSPNVISNLLDEILGQYGRSFASKQFGGESSDVDDLMLVFGLTQEIKAQNRQYWGRELGMCWQRLVTELFRQTHSDFSEPIREGANEICDLVVGTDALDTKYRIGSGDSGTLKKFRQYGLRLQELGYRPVLLILREDNLQAAINSCVRGGWTVITGEATFMYVQNATGFDLQSWLQVRRNRFAV